MNTYIVAVYSNFAEVNKIEYLKGGPPEKAIEKHSLLIGYEDVADEITNYGKNKLKADETIYFNGDHAITFHYSLKGLNNV